MQREVGFEWQTFVVMARVWDDFFLFLGATKKKKKMRELLEPPPTPDPLYHTCVGAHMKTKRDQVRFPRLFRPGAIHRPQPHTGQNKTNGTRNDQCLPAPRRSPRHSPRCLRHSRVASAPPPPFRLLLLPPVLRPAASRRPARHMGSASHRDSLLSARRKRERSSDSRSGAEGLWPSTRSSAQSGISGVCADGVWPAARSSAQSRPLAREVFGFVLWRRRFLAIKTFNVREDSSGQSQKLEKLSGC